MKVGDLISMWSMGYKIFAVVTGFDTTLGGEVKIFTYETVGCDLRHSTRYSLPMNGSSKWNYMERLDMPMTFSEGLHSEWTPEEKLVEVICECEEE